MKGCKPCKPKTVLLHSSHSHYWSIVTACIQWNAMWVQWFINNNCCFCFRCLPLRLLLNSLPIEFNGFDEEQVSWPIFFQMLIVVIYFQEFRIEWLLILFFASNHFIESTFCTFVIVIITCRAFSLLSHYLLLSSSSLLFVCHCLSSSHHLCCHCHSCHGRHCFSSSSSSSFVVCHCLIILVVIVAHFESYAPGPPS